MRPWKTLSRHVILDHNYLTVEEHRVELPDGRVIPDWPWIITPDYVNVVATTDGGAFLCFRQVKYAVDGACLALIGGYLEPGEAPLEGAQRELREETGYASPDWVPLGSYVLDGNRGVAVAHFYLARQARRLAPLEADDLEEQELLHLTEAEVVAALRGGEFKVLPWAAALMRALLWLDDRLTER